MPREGGGINTIRDRLGAARFDVDSFEDEGGGRGLLPRAAMRIDGRRGEKGQAHHDEGQKRARKS